MAYQLRFYHEQEFLPDGHEDFSVMDERILKLADDIREYLGCPILINHGNARYCGYRPADCKVGAPKSYHRKGQAVDLHPEGMTAEEARTKILKGAEAGLFPELGRMEADVNWVHCDLGPRKNGKVYVFHA